MLASWSPAPLCMGEKTGSEQFMIFILTIDNGVRKYMAIPAPPSYSAIPNTEGVFGEVVW